MGRSELRVSPARGQETALGSPASSGRPPNRTVTDLVAVAESGLVSSALNQPTLGMGWGGRQKKAVPQLHSASFTQKS